MTYTECKRNNRCILYFIRLLIIYVHKQKRKIDNHGKNRNETSHVMSQELPENTNYAQQFIRFLPLLVRPIFLYRKILFTQADMINDHEGNRHVYSKVLRAVTASRVKCVPENEMCK